MRGFLKLLVTAAPAFGHSIFTNLWVNGVSQGALNGIRYPSYDGPVTDVTSPSIICNGDPNPLTTPYSQTIITVPAGATIQHEWHHTLTSTMATDTADPIDPSHLGPVMVYMAKVDSALQTSVTGLKWFKIAEWGLQNNVWGTQQLWNLMGKMPATIPSCIPSGNYFLRAEIIALHGASTYPGAQFYMECAQINVTGGGSTQPATVSFPGAYAGSDPGITINIYYPAVTNYTIPGPPVFSCSGSSGSTPPTTTAKPTTTATTAKPTTTTAAPPTTTSSTSGTVAHYGQCGGQGWTGATACVAPYTCTVSNQYYSQCL